MKMKGWLIAVSTAGSLALSPAFAGEHAQAGAQGQAMGSQAGAQQASSETIRSVQQSLSEQGYDAGPVDGIMGPKTREALKEFQQAQGLDASGELNEQSLAEMGLEREAAEFAAGEVREDSETGAQPGGSSPGESPDESGMGGSGGMGGTEGGSGQPSQPQY